VDRSRIVQAYWEEYAYRQRGDHAHADECFWAWEWVDDAARVGSDDVIDLLVALADAAADDFALGYLGAGPVEDLVNNHGERLIDAIETAASEHPAFAGTLSGINTSSATEAEKMVERRLARFQTPPGGHGASKGR
jgi:hypothetical protein